MEIIGGQISRPKTKVVALSRLRGIHSFTRKPGELLCMRERAGRQAAEFERVLQYYMDERGTARMDFWFYS